MASSRRVGILAGLGLGQRQLHPAPVDLVGGARRHELQPDDGLGHQQLPDLLAAAGHDIAIGQQRLERDARGQLLARIVQCPPGLGTGLEGARALQGRGDLDGVGQRRERASPIAVHQQGLGHEDRPALLQRGLREDLRQGVESCPARLPEPPVVEDLGRDEQVVLARGGIGSSRRPRGVDVGGGDGLSALQQLARPGVAHAHEGRIVRQRRQGGRGAAAEQGRGAEQGGGPGARAGPGPDARRRAGPPGAYHRYADPGRRGGRGVIGGSGHAVVRVRVHAAASGDGESHVGPEYPLPRGDADRAPR